MSESIWDQLKKGLRGAIELQPSSINSDLGNYEIRSFTADKISAGTLDASQIDVTNLDANNITSGTITFTMGLGGANVKIDGVNKRIIVNDGTNDRVLIGYQSGGF